MNMTPRRARGMRRSFAALKRVEEAVSTVRLRTQMPTRGPAAPDSAEVPAKIVAPSHLR